MKKQENPKSTKTVILALVGFLVLAGLLAAAYIIMRPDAAAGAKTIHVTVVKAPDAEKTYEIKTDAANLRQALEEQDLISGEESPLGLFVQTVDGVTADPDKQQWWCFTKGGGELFTGVNDTPLEDGDSFEITLTAG